MKNTLIASFIALVAAGSVAAETPVLSGEVSLDFAETTSNNWGGTMGLDLDINAGGAASVSLGFTATDGNSLTLDTWTVGTTVGSVGVAFGDDNGVFVGAEGEQTLAAPAMTESLKVSVGNAEVAIGFTDYTTDISDISNIQGSYSLGEVAGLGVTVAGDYNMDTKNTVVGATVGGLTLGSAELSGTVTYDNDAEAFGFEGVANVADVTVYANGDNNDTLQNIGGSYDYGLAGATLSVGANYDVDAEDLTPTVGVSFAF